MNKHLLPLVAGASLVAASASAQFTESFDLGLADGEAITDVNYPAFGNQFGTSGVLFSTTDLDGVGGSLLIGSGGGPFISGVVPTITAGSTYDFGFWVGSATPLGGARIMFATGGNKSDQGFGINFDVNADNEITASARVEKANQNGINIGTAARADGTFTYDGTTGFVTIDWFDVGGNFIASSSSESLITVGFGNDITFRPRNAGQSYFVDGISVAIPEPSTYAAIAGLLALGFVAYRRRK